MTLALVLATLAAVLLLALASAVQLLYLESLRLRSRDLPALQFFKNTLEEKIGLETDDGAMAFSLIKHCTLAVLGALVLAACLNRPLDWVAFLEACFLSVAAMLVATYGLPQLLYRRSNGRWLGPLVPLVRVLALVVMPAAAVLHFFYSLVEIADEKQGT